MKNMYVCEKCNKAYDTYDAAFECENSHHDTARLEVLSAEYSHGNPAPDTITVEMHPQYKYDQIEVYIYKRVGRDNALTQDRLIALKQKQEQEEADEDNAIAEAQSQAEEWFEKLQAGEALTIDGYSSWRARDALKKLATTAGYTLNSERSFDPKTGKATDTYTLTTVEDKSPATA